MKFNFNPIKTEGNENSWLYKIIAEPVALKYSGNWRNAHGTWKMANCINFLLIHKNNVNFFPIRIQNPHFLRFGIIFL